MKKEISNEQLPEALATDKGQSQVTKPKMLSNFLSTNYKFILIPTLLIGGYFIYKKYKK